MKKPVWKRVRILGFSLTEIMAVSAIVTSIPAAQYARAKQKAHETACRNNLQQIGQIIEMYHMSEGYYPKAVFFPREPLTDPDSIVRILEDAGYNVPREMWICPAAPDALREKGLTFVYNDQFGGRTSLKKPSQAWLLIEINCVSRKVDMPHPAGYNVLCADGHVITTRTLPPDILRLQQAALDRVLSPSAPGCRMAMQEDAAPAPDENRNLPAAACLR